MTIPRLLRAMGAVDALSVRRDAMLRWMIFLPLVIALAMRLVLPIIVARLDGWLPFDLQPLFEPLVGALFLLVVPFMWGMLGGFLLLDERDDHTLEALQITPLPLSRYLLYRLGLPAALSVVAITLLFPLLNLATPNPLTLLLLALTAAPLAPVVALLLAALAENKVQGLALTKASGLLVVPALAAYFLPHPWRLLLAVAPTFWPTQAFWQALGDGSDLMPYVVVGLAYQLLLIMFLARRFERIMHR